MKTHFSDLGIYAQEALKNLTQHCPRMLEAMKNTGEIDHYLAMIDQEVPKRIQKLYQKLQERNPISKTANHQEQEQHNTWLMRTAKHLVTKEMIYLPPETEMPEPEIDEMKAWKPMLPEMDDEDLGCRRNLNLKSLKKKKIRTIFS